MAADSISMKEYNIALEKAIKPYVETIQQQREKIRQLESELLNFKIKENPNKNIG